MKAGLLPAAVACVALALGACGDDSGDENSSAGPTALTVKMTDYEFEPDDVTVAQGDAITVTNEGGIAHNLTIEKGPDPRDETDKLAGTSSFLKGKSVRLEVNIPAGRYAMVCTVPGHRELGMVGRLRVRRPGAP
jgi:plastocyanin